MTPERAMLFLCYLNKAGWLLVVGPYSVVAVHPMFGPYSGDGDDMSSRVDCLRRQLQERKLSE